MVKRLTVITFLSLAFACSSYAQDGSRLDQLEKEIQALDQRFQARIFTNSSVAQTAELSISCSSAATVSGPKSCPFGQPIP